MAVLNVKDYGAIGDGITNDTAAFQAALADLLNVYEKGYLYCPSGTYVITQQLDISKPFIGIQGDGIQATVLQFASKGLKLSSYADFSFGVVKGLTINGPTMSGTGIYNSVGIEMPNANFYFLSEFLVANFDIGIDATTAVLSKFTDFSVIGCKIGARFTSGSYAVSIINGNVRGCTETGIDESGSSLYITTTDIEAIGVHSPVSNLYEGGVSIKTGGSVTISDCHFETSEVTLGLNSPYVEAIMENSYVGGCLNGVKQLQSGIGGRFDFKNIKFSGVTTEFEIPDVAVYRIDDCTARYAAGGTKNVVYHVNPNEGMIKEIRYSDQGRWISFFAHGMELNGKQILSRTTFYKQVAIGSVAANTSQLFTVELPGEYIVNSGSILNWNAGTYIIPPGLLFTFFVYPSALYNTIGINVTNTTGSAINVATPEFRIDVIS